MNAGESQFVFHFPMAVTAVPTIPPKLIMTVMTRTKRRIRKEHRHRCSGLNFQSPSMGESTVRTDSCMSFTQHFADFYVDVDGENKQPRWYFVLLTQSSSDRLFSACICTTISEEDAYSEGNHKMVVPQNIPSSVFLNFCLWDVEQNGKKIIDFCTNQCT